MAVKYSVHELAELSGVSIRTLHYYDEIGLLLPQRGKNQYRWYEEPEVDRLQQILLYREIGMKLSTIKEVLDDPSFDKTRALVDHLSMLHQQRNRIENLIANVEKTLAYYEGKAIMSDKEKFDIFKKDLIQENERKYGKEIRNAYGDKSVDESNAKLAGMSEAQWRETEELQSMIVQGLKEALIGGDPASKQAQAVCDLHKKWLCAFWGTGKYTLEAHKNLGEMYVADERFKEYYESIATGATEFLRDALIIYCSKAEER